MGNLVSLTDHCDLFFVCKVDITSHLISETPCGPYQVSSCACVSMRTVQVWVGVSVSWGPPSSMPTSSSEPLLRPCIQGVWALPPGAGLQAQTPQRGIWTPQPGSGPAQETQLAPHLHCQLRQPSHIPYRWARGLTLLLQLLPPPCNHSCTRTTF